MSESETSQNRHHSVPRLSPKEIKFLKAYMKTGNASQSALAAGHVTANPDVIGAQLMKRLRAKVPEILERIGLQPEKVLRKVLVAGLEAKKTDFYAHQGIVLDHRETVDHEQRGKFLDRYCKLLGLYGDEHDGHGTSGATQPIVINLAFLGAERATGVLAAARERLSSANRGQLDVDAQSDENPQRPEDQ